MLVDPLFATPIKPGFHSIRLLKMFVVVARIQNNPIYHKTNIIFSKPAFVNAFYVRKK